MDRESGHVPEEEKSEKRYKSFTPDQALDLTQQEVDRQVAEFLRSDDQVVDDFLDKMKKSSDLSKQAGEFIKSLIPKSLNKPKKEYAEPGRDIIFDLPPHIEQAFREQYEKFRESLSSQEAISKLLQDIGFDTFDKQFIGEVSREHHGERRFQSRTIATPQDGGSNVVVEKINNFLFEDDEGRPWSRAFAGLVIRNTETDTNIDLQQLLPKKFLFAPGALNRHHEGPVREVEGKLFKSLFQDLQDLTNYTGPQDGKDYDFAFRPVEGGLSDVTYGDLSKKGGMLSLLHEIAHSWQGTYGLANARQKFDSTVHWLRVYLRVLQSMKDDINVGQWTQEAYDQITLPRCKDKLAELGIEINDDYLKGEEELKPDEIRFSDPNSVKFKIKSETLGDLIDDYAREERDAWAHAIRVMRFLRKQGFDIEPELKTLEDVEQEVHSSLESYREHINETFEFDNYQGRQFTRRPKKEEK